MLLFISTFLEKEVGGRGGHEFPFLLFFVCRVGAKVMVMWAWEEAGEGGGGRRKVICPFKGPQSRSERKRERRNKLGVGLPSQTNARASFCYVNQIGIYF